MAEAESVEAALRRVMEANLSYYRGIGRLTVSYWGAVLGTLEEIRLPVRLGGPAAPAGPGPAGHQHTPSLPAPPTPAPPPQAPAMVLEGRKGQQALGVFLVENRLQNRVSTPIMASAFVDPEGAEVRPALVLDPEVVTLDPGEQLLVRVAALMNEPLRPDVDYRGELSIPGLSGSRVKLVLRWRPDPAPKRVRATKPRRSPAGDGATRKRGRRA